MKKSRILFLIAAALTLLLAGCGQSSSYRFGTGNNGGMYYKYGSRMAQLLSEEKSAELSVKETAGSAANLRLINEGFLKLAITQGDVLSDAASGSGIFQDKDYSGGYGALAALYTEACQIIVPEASPVQNVTDLSGLRISVGEKESGVQKNAIEILAGYGITTEMIEPEYLSFTDSANALKAGEIDAFFCTAGAPTAAVTELASTMKIRILSIDERVRKNLQKQHNGYTQCTLPANTYPGQTEAISTLGVKAVLIASSKMKKDDAATITRFVLGHRQALCNEMQLLYDNDLSYVTEDIPCGFHEGAAAVYEEMGISVETAERSKGNRITGHQDQ